MTYAYEVRDPNVVKGRIQRQAAAGRRANPTRLKPAKGEVRRPRILPPTFGCNLSSATLRQRKVK